MLNESLHAEELLARMDCFEDLHELWRTEAFTELREQLAQQYRDIIGIPPEQEGEFRESLETIHSHGIGTVSDVIAKLGYSG